MTERAGKFIDRWQGSSGAERANYALFLVELCDLIGVDRPNPAGSDTRLNEYVFERGVRFLHDDGSTSPGRIDLCKKGCFVLEAKQSKKRQEGGETYEQLPLELKGGVGVLERPRPAKAKAKPATSWDVLMRGAKRQAEDPNRNTFRITIDDLRSEGVRAGLKDLWGTPFAPIRAQSPKSPCLLVTSRLAFLKTLGSIQGMCGF